MRGAFRSGAATTVTIALLATGGCQRVDAGSPVAAIAVLVARDRQCAPLIAGAWPIDLGAEAFAAPGIDALVAAGLIRRDTARPDPLARPEIRIAVTPAGREWIELRRLNDGGTPIPVLCYGRRQLVDATVDRQSARYRFRVVGAAPWVARADIRAAFPFLRTALTGPIAAEQPAVLEGGGWRLPDHAAWHPGVSLERKGFYPCRPDDRDKACGGGASGRVVPDTGRGRTGHGPGPSSAIGVRGARHAACSVRARNRLWAGDG